ncbi:hypothetical protein GA840_01695 [Pediococcus ethanolidurans]|uniref:hypothetical protein n=1 Tax=Pediococcus ethanolidurans TaxID=319653 RepID=UPI0029530D2E|nr:hypothetical protein [Pediococcus ethanolidurans]MDV7718592.1 hypothetical protein [Pediococcus ethanolidurans]
MKKIIESCAICSLGLMILSVSKLLVVFNLLDHGRHYVDYQINLWGAAWTLVLAMIFNIVVVIPLWVIRKQ